MPAQINLRAIKHFVEVARQGSHPASTNAEKVANRIAKTLHTIGDDICLLDSDALQGLCEVLHLMHGPWPTYESKEAIYELVRKSAGKKR